MSGVYRSIEQGTTRLWRVCMCLARCIGVRGKLLDSPNREAEEPAVAVRGTDTTRTEAQVVAVSRRVQRRRPVVAVRAVAVETRTAPVARGGEDNRVAVNARSEATTCHAILIGPLRVAVAVQLLELTNGRHAAWGSHIVACCVVGVV